MKKENDPTDNEQLWEALRAGHEDAFECLYRRYFRDLFHYGRQFLRDKEVVNDAIQDLFVDLWRTRRSLGAARSVKFYLMASLRRKIHRSLGADRHLTTDLEDVPESMLPILPSAETDFAAQEESYLQTKKLNGWLDQLPPRQREALLLRYYHDMEYAEIAALLNIGEQTSRNLVQKALCKLREIYILLVISIIAFIF